MGMRNQQDYIEKVIKQLVKETEIDFNNHRVKLEVANFSFPFYSFGGRRANAENLIAEPKGNFGNYVINTYGVNETEYKEIYAMYMGIIASRLQDHDENVNHLYLHEHTQFDEKEYHYATQVLDRMVRESKINTTHKDPSQWDIYAPHMGRWISPLGFISPNNRHWNAFEGHVMDIYGLDWNYVGPVWDNYLKEVTKSFRQLARKAQGDDTPPWSDLDMQYDYLAEGLNNQKYLHKVLERLVGETMVEYDYEYAPPIAYPTWVIDDNEGVDLGVLLDSGYDHWNFQEFKDYVKDMYGLTNAETMDIWQPYLNGVDEKFNIYITQNNLNHPWRTHWVNESKEDLNVKVHKAVNDTFKKNKGLKGQHRITRYFMKHYELDKQDADEAMVQYLSKQQSMNE